MEVRANCRTCHKEWVISVLHKNYLNYECPPCEKKRLHRKWLNKKKTLTVGKPMSAKENNPISLYPF